MPILSVAIETREAEAGARRFKAAGTTIEASAKGAAREVDKLERDSLGRFIARAGATDRSASLMAGAFGRVAVSANLANTSALLLVGSFGRLAGVVGAGEGTRRAVRTFADFDQAMAGLRVDTNATTAELEQFKNAALDIENIAPTQAILGLTELAQTGLDAAKSIRALPAATHLAKAGNIELAEGARLLGGTLKQLNLDVSESANVSDVIFAGAQKSGTGLKEFAAGFTNAANVADSFGLAIEDTAAAIAVLSQQQIRGGEAGQGLIQVLRTLGSEFSPEQRRQIQALGLDVKDVSLKFVTFEEAIINLKRAGLSAGGAVDLFGRGSEVATELIQNTDLLKQFAGELKVVEGAAASAAAILNDTLKQSFAEVGNEFRAFSIALLDGGFGDALKGGADLLAAGLRGVTGQLRDSEKYWDQFDGLETRFKKAAVGAGSLSEQLKAVRESLEGAPAQSFNVEDFAGIKGADDVLAKLEQHAEERLRNAAKNGMDAFFEELDNGFGAERGEITGQLKDQVELFRKFGASFEFDESQGRGFSDALVSIAENFKLVRVSAEDAKTIIDSLLASDAAGGATGVPQKLKAQTKLTGADDPALAATLEKERIAREQATAGVEAYLRALQFEASIADESAEAQERLRAGLEAAGKAMALGVQPTLLAAVAAQEYVRQIQAAQAAAKAEKDALDENNAVLKQNAQARESALGGLGQQARAIELEIELIGKSNEERRKAIELEYAQQTAKLGGLGEKDPDVTRIGELLDELSRAERIQAAAQTLGDAFGSAAGQIAVDFENLDSIIESTIKGLIQQLITLQASKAFTNLFAFLGGGGATPPVFGPPAPVVNAKGNAFVNGALLPLPNPLPIPFASGGLFSGPTIIPLAGGKKGIFGEAGLELAVPAVRNERGQVSVQIADSVRDLLAAAGGGRNVTININGGTQSNGQGTGLSERQIARAVMRGMERAR